jgi:hypothetical protein
MHQPESTTFIALYGVGASIAFAWLGAFVAPVFFFALAIVLPAVLLIAAFERVAPP